MRILFLLFMLHAIVPVRAQREAHRWYFGPEGAGLDFSTCPPTVLDDGLGAATFEGACTISDPVTMAGSPMETGRRAGCAPMAPDS